MRTVRRVVLVGVIVLGGLFGRWAGADDGRVELAQTTGGSNSGGGGNSGNSGNSGNNRADGSSGSSGNSNGDSNNGDSNGDSNNGDSSSSGSGDGAGGTGVTTPGGGGGGTNNTAPSGPEPSIPAERVEQAKSTGCPDDAGAGTRCFRVRPDDDTEGVRLPDGRIVALPDGPEVNVDTGASTSNDVDQVIIVNNDNRVIGQERAGRIIAQWILATLGLLVLVLVAAAAGAAIFRAGLKQGRKEP